MKMFRLSVILLFFLAIGQLNTKAQNQPLPFDSTVTKGILPNGLTYYVKSNGKPANRAELRLVVSAGSVLEDDDQQGIAHFCEHMAFNGTKHFPKHEIIKYFESIGMDFGPEINAYTNFDETVYMLKIPLDKSEYIDKGLQVLYDWACENIDSDKEINLERGVIKEEWRSGLGADERMRDKWFPTFFNGSKYEKRMPIGKMDIIDHCDPAVVRRFRHDWYRPDLQAVVVVGDFDQKEMTQRIKTLFSEIPSRANSRPKELVDIPDHQDTRIAIVTDKEASSSMASIYYKLPKKISETTDDYRENLVQNLCNMMLSSRLKELTQKPNPPFIYGGYSYSSFVGPKDVFNGTVACYNNKIAEGFKALLTEAERVKRFGFTESELDRQKMNLMASFQKMYAEREKIDSKQIVDELVRNFLDDKEPVPGIENEFKYANQFLPEISIDEVNKEFNSWMIDSNRVVIVTAPSSVEVPTKQEIESVLETVSKEDLTPYSDGVKDVELVKEITSKGAVVSENEIPAIGGKEFVLSNGAKVVYKKTKFQSDQILFSAWSMGGMSLYDASYDMSSSVASSIMAMSGLGEFSKINLDKILSGKMVSVSPYISNFSEGFSGQSNNKEFETLFKLVYLYFTAHKVDQEIYNSYITRLKGALANRQNSPETMFSDTLQAAVSNYNKRGMPIQLSDLQKIDYSKVKEIVNDRFQDPSDFVFTFVGNINEDSLKIFAEKYIASIPSTNRNEKWKDLGIEFPNNIIEKEVVKGSGAKSQSAIIFENEMKSTRKNILAADISCKILTTRLLDKVREEQSSVYYIGASPSFTRIPEEECTVQFSYVCSPNKATKIKHEIFDEIRQVISQGVLEDELQTAKKKISREREGQLKKNGFWLSVIKQSYMYKEGDFSKFYDFEKDLNKIKGKDILKSYKNIFNLENYVSVVLKPENN